MAIRSTIRTVRVLDTVMVGSRLALAVCFSLDRVRFRSTVLLLDAADPLLLYLPEWFETMPIFTHSVHLPQISLDLVECIFIVRSLGCATSFGGIKTGAELLPRFLSTPKTTILRRSLLFFSPVIVVVVCIGCAAGSVVSRPRHLPQHRGPTSSLALTRNTSNTPTPTPTHGVRRPRLPRVCRQIAHLTIRSVTSSTRSGLHSGGGGCLCLSGVLGRGRRIAEKTTLETTKAT